MTIIHRVASILLVFSMQVIFAQDIEMRLDRNFELDLYFPTDICGNEKGDIFVLDGMNNRVVEINRGGQIRSIRPDRSSIFKSVGMAIINDKIWIADTPRARILELGLNGRINRVMALEPGTEPVDLVQVNNRIAVSDRANHRIIILDMDGNKVSTWGSRGGDMGEFIYPGLMAEGPENRLIVADILNRRVVTFSPSGRFPQLVAKPGLKKGQIARPKGIALDGDNNIWVSDGYTGTLQLFSSSGNFLGLATIGGETLRANAPMGLWVDAVNRLWVVESASNKISVYRITNE